MILENIDKFLGFLLLIGFTVLILKKRGDEKIREAFIQLSQSIYPRIGLVLYFIALTSLLLPFTILNGRTVYLWDLFFRFNWVGIPILYILVFLGIFFSARRRTAALFLNTITFLISIVLFFFIEVSTIWPEQIPNKPGVLLLMLSMPLLGFFLVIGSYKPLLSLIKKNKAIQESK